MTTDYKCMCGAFEASLKGPPVLAVWCHCSQCRVQTGSPMQLGVWTPDNFQVTKGDDTLIKYKSGEKVFRNSCSSCGSFCYKVLPDGAMVAPLGALSPKVEPTCNIFCKPEHRGEHKIMAPDLPVHDEFP